ncbi:MAG: DUF2062 domain-containing protein [Desulfobulbaceae bacterium]|nr:DUF2062 domain-containing protein [Desulfobulbaceae bacterium]
MARAGYENIMVVIPVYNHGATLPAVVEAVIAAGWPVLVVDDGSSDEGLRAISDFDCYLTQLPRNMGKGAAIMAGAREAQKLGYGRIITLDADGQHDPDDAVVLAERSAKHEGPAIIIGARRMIQETVPKSSLFGRDFSNFWVKLECGLDLADTQSGMRLYPVKELLQLNPGRLRYDFEVEVLVRAAWAGVAIDSVEISVHYPPRDERVSHFHKLKDNLRLTGLHTLLIGRRLIPWPHLKLVKQSTPRLREQLVVRHPLKTLKKICRENASPAGQAVAVWMGLFLGALPLIACHTLVIIYVTHRLHMNKVAAVAASQFCAPPVVPVLCIQVGFFMVNGRLLLDLSWQKWLLEIPQRLGDWLLGSLIVGPLLGFVGAGLIYWFSSRLQAHKKAQLSGH